MTILEAMASGLPVVATRVGAAGDVIDNGGTGMLVPARDVAAMTAAVRSLLRDDHGIGAAARQEVARNVHGGRDGRPIRRCVPIGLGPYVLVISVGWKTPRRAQGAILHGVSRQQLPNSASRSRSR